MQETQVRSLIQDEAAKLLSPDGSLEGKVYHKHHCDASGIPSSWGGAQGLQKDFLSAFSSTPPGLVTLSGASWASLPMSTENSWHDWLSSSGISWVGLPTSPRTSWARPPTPTGNPWTSLPISTGTPWHGWLTSSEFWQYTDHCVTCFRSQGCLWP